MSEALTAYANSLHGVSCCCRYIYDHTLRDDPSPVAPIMKLVKRAERKKTMARVTLQQPVAETVVTGSKGELPVTLQQPAAETVVTGSTASDPMTACSRDCGHRQHCQ